MTLAWLCGDCGHPVKGELREGENPTGQFRCPHCGAVQDVEPAVLAEV